MLIDMPKKILIPIDDTSLFIGGDYGSLSNEPQVELRDNKSQKTLILFICQILVPS